VIEIVSPSTRTHDLGAKRRLYYRLGVPKYVLVNRWTPSEAPVQLLGYERGPRGWRRLRPHAQGRLDLAPVGMKLGLEGERPWLYDAVTAARAPDRMEWQHLLTATETRATVAEARVQEEAQARAALEARVRALEVQLRRQQDDG
jgi:hypothetical protein